MIQTDASEVYGKAVRTRPAVGVALILALAFAPAAPSSARAEDPSTYAAPALRAADLFTLAKLSEKFFQSAPEASQLNVEKIVAFEEHPRFVYLAGSSGEVSAGKLLRRIVLFKPGTFVVDDRVQVAAAAATVRWTLLAHGKIEIDGKKFNVIGPEGELSGQTLLGDGTVRRVLPNRADAAEQILEITAKADNHRARFLHVFQVRRPDDKGPRPQCRLAREGGRWRLTVTGAAGTLKLWLPAGSGAAGTIAITGVGAIAGADGQSVLSRRLLPWGIMPHGEEGVRMLRRWDTPYHGDRRPGWDTGRVAPELKKLIENNTVKPGRAVVFGCGTGTNAIYLAGKGFEVTGIDVAPTALGRARRKARQAGVNVRWMMADVLAPPELKPFDLIFDRGCYHHVRQYNAAGYVNTVRRLSRPGTRLLLLAGSAKEPRPGGPPKIKEEEIRTDFSAGFDVEWLREIRFDPVQADAKGPLAWSVLLRRQEKQ